MQKNLLAEKIRIFIDGAEFNNVYLVGERISEKGTVEVSDGEFTRTIDNGQKSVSPFDVEFGIEKDSPVLAFLKKWYKESQYKDVSVSRTGADNVEFENELHTDTRLSKLGKPSYDSSTASPGKVIVTMQPYNTID